MTICSEIFTSASYLVRRSDFASAAEPIAETLGKDLSKPVYSTPLFLSYLPGFLSGGAIYPHADGGVFLTVVSLRIAFTLRRAPHCRARAFRASLKIGRRRLAPSR